MRDLFLLMSHRSDDIQLVLLTMFWTIVACVAAHWLCGCYEPKQYFPPRKNPSTGHRIEKERA